MDPSPTYHHYNKRSHSPSHSSCSSSHSMSERRQSSEADGTDSFKKSRRIGGGSRNQEPLDVRRQRKRYEKEQKKQLFQNQDRIAQLEMIMKDLSKEVGRKRKSKETPSKPRGHGLDNSHSHDIPFQDVDRPNWFGTPF